MNSEWWKQSKIIDKRYNNLLGSTTNAAISIYTQEPDIIQKKMNWRLHKAI
ncbi:hypothetical protein HMPREF0670_02407 [Prevotella sp. oral taxon 317 str. F0108]|nr:hypothetical protein HMPREF0670_02407 [Prevotella sp. oral taxon 317 str. F0108]